MLKDIVFNSINKITLCLNTKPLRVKKDAFYLIKLLDFN